MQKIDFVEKNPLRILYPVSEGCAILQRMGLVMARAGVGKTAILVQMALDNLLCGNKVLHVSIGESIEKTKTWYDDLLKHIVAGQEPQTVAEIYNKTMRNRLIMTFKESEFSRPKLEERVNDLVYQDIFRPNCLIIDGFDFAAADRQVVQDIREMMQAMDCNVWFSAVSRRADQRVSEDGIPAPCHDVDDLFDTIIFLQPEKQSIALNIIKDTSVSKAGGKNLNLDPVTLLIKEA